MFAKLLDRLEEKFGRRCGIRNLMTLVVAGMAAAYIGDLILYYSMGISMTEWLMFDKAAILRGEVWRVFTFIFIPPNSSLIFIFFALYFYWMLGNALEMEWGIFRFTVFYTAGMLCNVIAGTITGYATSEYLNLSLFLAGALVFPEHQLNIYGIFPVKMKWMGLLSLALQVFSFAMGSFESRVAMIVSLLNVLLFFMNKLIIQIKNARRRYEWKKNWRNGTWR